MLDQIVAIVAITSLVMVSPGPDMILVLRNTVVSGRRAGLHTSLGVLAGNMVHITYCVLGIGLLISQSIAAFATLRYAGAAYLIYLGIMSFRSGNNPPETRPVHQHPPRQPSFVQGFVNNLLNPKGTLFYLGVFTTVITPDTPLSAMAVLILAMMTISTSFWLLFVYTLDRPGIRGIAQRSQRTINRVSGVVLIAFGVRVALSQR